MRFLVIQLLLENCSSIILGRSLIQPGQRTTLSLSRAISLQVTTIISVQYSSSLYSCHMRGFAPNWVINLFSSMFCFTSPKISRQ